MEAPGIVRAVVSRLDAALASRPTYPPESCVDRNALETGRLPEELAGVIGPAVVGSCGEVCQLQRFRRSPEGGENRFSCGGVTEALGTRPLSPLDAYVRSRR
jgi:hypothetical protein